MIPELGYGGNKGFVTPLVLVQTGGAPEIHDANGLRVAMVLFNGGSEDTPTPRAESIIRCVNAHDALVAALADIGAIKVDDARDDFLRPAVIALTALAQLE